MDLNDYTHDLFPEICDPEYPLHQYSGTEVHPCRVVEATSVEHQSIERCAADQAQFWSVYLTFEDTVEVECVADFTRQSEAETHAQDLREQIKLAIASREDQIARRTDEEAV